MKARDPIDTYRVLVLDMQPIDPPVGGGRIRLLGLYHGLGKSMPTTYVGTYDWPGENFRKHRLTDTLEEIDVPLSDSHFQKVKEWEIQVAGKTIIDATFHQLAHLSLDFIERATKEVLTADIVVFSHPWIYPLVKDVLKPESQLIVYDSQNFEGLLRTTLLDDGSFGTEIVKEVVRVEHDLCHYANLILTCSHEDRELFSEYYHLPFKKIKVVPNGVFVSKICAADLTTKSRAKRELGITQKAAGIFIGSAYEPNIEAARFICQKVAPELPELAFVLAGGVGDSLSHELLRESGVSNVIITGLLSEEQKLNYLAAADLAVNPMCSGSGTNIKMFDFMAAGLPVVTTPIGARGIEGAEGPAFRVCHKEEFVCEIRSLCCTTEKDTLSNASREFVREHFSWERISPNLGMLLHRHRSKLANQAPFFSVIVATYGRHPHLSDLIERLCRQTWHDFEVIIVDQTEEIWPERNDDHNLDLFYIHTDIRGAVKARNLACFHARGEVFAFTDDDCQPKADWLENARPYFDKEHVVGVEGLIRSEKLHDPNYRTVSNVDFEGLGFMTANLFLKHEVFNAVNGFDIAFDNPHFREDTDLAWRALEHGDIPFAREVEVFHPPHARNIQRESSSERCRFFEKDALLMKKHPEKYKTLFLAEAQWEKPGFWEHFLRGSKKYGTQIPDFYLSRMPKDIT